MTPTASIAAALALAAAAAAPAGDPPDPLERFDRPPAVTASFKDEPVARALAELCRQAGCRPIAVEGDGKAVTLEVKDLPFWTAVDRLLDGAGHLLAGSAFEDPPGEGGGFGAMDPLRAVPREGSLRRAAPCSDGPVRVALVAVVAEKSGKAVHRFSPEAERPEEGKTTLRAGLKFAAIDGLDAAEGALLRVDSAVDEKGKKLVPLPPESQGGHGAGGIPGERWVVFEEGSGFGGRMAEFAGALVVRIPRGETTVELDLAALPAKATVGGTTLTVTAAGEGTMRIEVAGPLFPPPAGAEPALPGLVIEEEGKERSPFHRPRVGDVRLLVRDAAGKVLGSSGYGAGGDGSSMTYDFELGGRPAKVVVRACKSVETREVPFRFKDVPLPR